jgi:hypothetical protein
VFLDDSSQIQLCVVRRGARRTLTTTTACREHSGQPADAVCTSAGRVRQPAGQGEAEAHEGRATDAEVDGEAAGDHWVSVSARGERFTSSLRHLLLLLLLLPSISCLQATEQLNPTDVGNPAVTHKQINKLCGL